MEKLDHLYCHTACGGQLIRTSDTKQYGNLRNDQQTGFSPAGLAVPGGLDDTVYHNGNRIISGAYIREAKRYRSDCLWRSACI